MNIITRTKNNLEYAYYRKLWDKANTKMKTYMYDAYDAKFLHWAGIAVHCAKKCLDIPLH